MESIEIWKDIPNYEGMYQVSSIGRVKSLSRVILRNGLYPFITKEKQLVLSKGKNEYLKTQLCRKGIAKTFKIHQLVAISFLNHIPCGSELVVNHINFIRTDNRLENLEIVTTRENSNKKHIKSSSKYTGVSWNKNKQKWRAFIVVKKDIIYLGSFINEIEAHNAYQKALINLLEEKNEKLNNN